MKNVFDTNNYERKPTQLELCESGRRHAANTAEGRSFLLRPENLPTLEELAKLRQKKPHLWNGFRHPLENK